MKKKRKDVSPPAFPQSVSRDAGGGVLASFDFEDGAGMTLRDYFAAKFLGTVRIHNDGADADEIARNCYIMADAMIKARKAK